MSDKALQAVQKITSLQGTYNIVLTTLLTFILTTIFSLILSLQLLIHDLYFVLFYFILFYFILFYFILFYDCIECEVIYATE